MASKKTTKKKTTKKAPEKKGRPDPAVITDDGTRRRPSDMDPVEWRLSELERRVSELED